MQLHTAIAAVSSTLVLLACGDRNGDPAARMDSCLDFGVATQSIVNGTKEPGHVRLAPGQTLALGTFGRCSGTVVSDEWVLSAAHCRIGAEDVFCVDEFRACVQVVNSFVHPFIDLAMVELAESLETHASSVIPIPIRVEAADASLVGQAAELAGYGETETTSGFLYFSAQPIVAVDEETITVDGEGVRGACFGDSGGPLLLADHDGGARVAGVLSRGSTSCVGLDHYVRVDIDVPWIESFSGPTTARPPCVE